MNEAIWEWPVGVTQAQWEQGASGCQLADGSRAINWHGLLLEGWQPLHDPTPRLSATGRLPGVKPTAPALRLCHAIGLASRVRVGQWVPIDSAFEILSATDQAAGGRNAKAAIGAGLVEINPGPVAHSIKLTEAGLAAGLSGGGSGSTDLRNTRKGPAPVSSSALPLRRRFEGSLLAQTRGVVPQAPRLDDPAATVSAAGTGVSRKVHSLLGQPKARLCLDQPSLRDCEMQSRLELLHRESPFVLAPTPPVLGNLTGHQVEEVRTRQHRLLEQGFAQHSGHAVSVGEVGSGHLGQPEKRPEQAFSCLRPLR